MSSTLLIDTNLIVLLVVGLADEKAVINHKRTRAYTIDDFRLLTEFISSIPEVAVIPNALSEASNLLSFEGDEHARSILNKFSIFLSRAKEKYIVSADAARRPEFKWLGLTDCALLEFAKHDVHLLTADVALHVAALKAGYSSTNFTHYIQAARA